LYLVSCISQGRGRTDEKRLKGNLVAAYIDGDVEKDVEL